ncbi:hypothetical protein SSYM_0507 [Serratia symbiotica str. Tucson]|uniref:Uncharacterized protein n=1 Tax=Serratia symbiotica str. Tucson TaxID=914128 RepID=E9CKE3_9GAMM|nr:hypothetical protein SSYM_0507 [Serratia symbiotica str. Tucson]
MTLFESELVHLFNTLYAMFIADSGLHPFTASLMKDALYPLASSFRFILRDLSWCRPTT